MKKEYIFEIIFAVVCVLLIAYYAFAWNHAGNGTEEIAVTVDVSEDLTLEFGETSLSALKKI